MLARKHLYFLLPLSPEYENSSRNNAASRLVSHYTKQNKEIHLKRIFIAKNAAIFPIGLGAMPLSISGRPSATKASNVIKAFLDNGGHLIDTADVYGLDDTDRGHNEKLIYQTIKKMGQKTYALLPKAAPPDRLAAGVYAVAGTQKCFAMHAKPACAIWIQHQLISIICMAPIPMCQLKIR